MNKLTANHIHFIGIGGISMSGLAEVLKHNGHTVTGSDDHPTPVTTHLQNIGIPVAIPNAATNITPAIDLVVYTAAVKETNPEYQAAKAQNIPLLERAELLGLMLPNYPHAICVAGTHGKTSSTALMSEILLEADLDPTISIGGHMGRDGTNYRVGNSSYFVLESCEYNNSYHHWHPHIGIILNMDFDHPDFFKDIDAVVVSFKKFAQNIRPEGVLVIQEGIYGQDTVTEDLDCEVVTFGTSKNADFWPRNITYNHLGHPSFEIMTGKNPLAQVHLPLPGLYNMLNALATFAAAFELGLAPEEIATALSHAKGVKRRFEQKGQYNQAYIIDDYAHHPTEITACLTAANTAIQKLGGKLYCLFQSHTYSRTKELLQDFAQSLTQTHHLGLLPIFPSRESFDPTISHLHLAQEVQKLSTTPAPDITTFQNFDEAVAFYKEKLCPNDMLITMGAGDVYIVGERVLLP